MLLTVGLNRAELLLLWGLFDQNGDNKMDLEEFEKIFSNDGKLASNGASRRRASQFALRRPSMIEVSSSLFVLLLFFRLL